mmetsp:Transcript_5681/g.11710  ORF Transcript_5681/g.11710 Transcript_5681/m.11710 type:complete len:212 (-) Transcript_5681:972-1607(-)
MSYNAASSFALVSEFFSLTSASCDSSMPIMAVRWPWFRSVASFSLWRRLTSWLFFVESNLSLLICCRNSAISFSLDFNLAFSFSASAKAASLFFKSSAMAFRFCVNIPSLPLSSSASFFFCANMAWLFFAISAFDLAVSFKRSCSAKNDCAVDSLEEIASCSDFWLAAKSFVSFCSFDCCSFIVRWSDSLSSRSFLTVSVNCFTWDASFAN